MQTKKTGPHRFRRAPAHFRCRHRSRRIAVRPLLGPPDSFDVTESLVAAIACELTKAQGGDELVNWLEAEMLLRSCLASSG